MNSKRRLELNWIGKDQRPRLEPRILIEEAEQSHHASVRTENDVFDNVLIHGDNLLALKSLETDFADKVKCVYIDPPFNTQQAFENYDDGIEHSQWLTLMRDRIEILHKLLHPEGSLFIHIDDNELGYLIAVVDEIFGRRNRVGIITFKQSSVSGPKSINPGMVTTANYILYYVKDKTVWEPTRIFVPRDRDSRYGTFIANRTEHYSKWKFEPLRSAVARKHGCLPKELAKKLDTQLEGEFNAFVVANASAVVQLASINPADINAKSRKALLLSQQKTDRIFHAPRADKDDLYFLNGKQILFYSSKVKEIDGTSVTGEALSNIWDDLLSNNVHKEGGVKFPNGKKPEALIKRLIELSALKGEIVLDSFAGSGTTGAVAHKMGRRWIMVELGDHCDTHIVPRLKRLIDGVDPDGVTKAMNWKGGGGFRYYHLAPSLLESDQWGRWVISKKYNATMLAEAMCKHMGFIYAPSQGAPEYWRHGNSSERDFIYVTTASLTHAQLKAISLDVGPDRTLLICCKAFNARLDELENLTVKKIPHTILSRCEWGRDDYSLKVASLPYKEESSAESALVVPKRGRTIKPESDEPSLFDTEREAQP